MQWLTSALVRNFANCQNIQVITQQAMERTEEASVWEREGSRAKNNTRTHTSGGKRFDSHDASIFIAPKAMNL